MRMTWPCFTPPARTLKWLFAFAGFVCLVRFSIRICERKWAAAMINAAPGRPWRPFGLAIVISIALPGRNKAAGSGSGAACPGSGAAEGASPAGASSASFCIVAACRAAFRTSARESPAEAWIAATKAPSTSGPPLRRVRAASPSSIIDMASFALRTALPRSARITTPAPVSARAIASAIRTASVPSDPSAVPPAATRRTDSPAISRATSTTPAAIRAEWETTTIPTSG